MKSYDIGAVVNGDFDCVPVKASEGASAYDLVCSESVWLHEKGVYTVKTGVSLEIPSDLCGVILPRSSLHMRGLSLANTIGLIDSDYRGEILLKLHFDGCNFDHPGLPVSLKKGTRLAQIVFLSTPHTTIKILDRLSETMRGSGGFGSTEGYGAHSDNEAF